MSGRGATAKCEREGPPPDEDGGLSRGLVARVIGPRGRLVGIDPGKSCGLVALDFELKEAIALVDTTNSMAYWLEGFKPEVVVIERWMLYPKMASKLYFHEMDGPEAIGYVRYWCVINQVPLHRVVASHRRPFLHYWPRHMPRTSHAKDAWACALYWLHYKGIPPETFDNWDVYHHEKEIPSLWDLTVPPRDD